MEGWKNPWIAEPAKNARKSIPTSPVAIAVVLCGTPAGATDQRRVENLAGFCT